jgi:hypothetical protein
MGRITRRPYDASAGETGFPTEGIDMKRFAIIVTTLAAVLALSATAALAGNAHFVGTPKAGTSGSTLTASGKVAGLGDESQIHVVVAAQAACVNRGQNFPQAANKQTFSSAGDFPVQNGKANFSLSVTATFQPKCSPPMTVVWVPGSITGSGDSFASFSYSF